MHASLAHISLEYDKHVLSTSWDQQHYWRLKQVKQCILKRLRGEYECGSIAYFNRLGTPNGLTGFVGVTKSYSKVDQVIHSFIY